MAVGQRNQHASSRVSKSFSCTILFCFTSASICCTRGGRHQWRQTNLLSRRTSGIPITNTCLSCGKCWSRAFSIASGKSEHHLFDDFFGATFEKKKRRPKIFMPKSRSQSGANCGQRHPQWRRDCGYSRMMIGPRTQISLISSAAKLRCRPSEDGYISVGQLGADRVGIDHLSILFISQISGTGAPEWGLGLTMPGRV